MEFGSNTETRQFNTIQPLMESIQLDSIIESVDKQVLYLPASTIKDFIYQRRTLITGYQTHENELG